MPADDAITASAGFVLFILIAWISVIDFRYFIIPDAANLTLGAAGLLYRFLLFRSFPLYSVAGALCLFLFLYLVRVFYLRFRNTNGLGLGDVKLGGAAALWLQPMDLPILLLVASITAIAAMLLFHTIKGGSLKSRRLPFGPFLGASLFVVWLGEAMSYSGSGFPV